MLLQLTRHVWHLLPHRFAGDSARVKRTYLLFAISVYLVVAVAVSPSALASKKTINILHTHNGGHFESILESFGKKNNLDLRVRWMDRNELKTRLLSGGNLASSPHIIIGPSDIVGLQQLNLVQNVEDVYTGPRTQISDKALITEKMLPIYKGNHLLLYYNKRYVREPAKDWKSLTDVRKSLSPAINVLAMPSLRMYMFMPFVSAFQESEAEGVVVNGKPNLDTPALRKALTFVWQQEAAGLLDIECDYECGTKKFLSREAAYAISGVWDYHQFSSVLGNDLGIAPLPKVNGKQMRPFGTYFIAMFPYKILDEYELMAINKIAGFFQSEPFQKQVFEVFKELPVLDGVVSDNDKTMKALVETFNVSKIFPVLENPETFWGGIFKGYVRYGSGAMTAEEASLYMQTLATQGL